MKCRQKSAFCQNALPALGQPRTYTAREAPEAAFPENTYILPRIFVERTVPSSFLLSFFHKNSLKQYLNIKAATYRLIFILPS